MMSSTSGIAASALSPYSSALLRSEPTYCCDSCQLPYAAAALLLAYVCTNSSSIEMRFWLSPSWLISVSALSSGVPAGITILVWEKDNKEMRTTAKTRSDFMTTSWPNAATDAAFLGLYGGELYPRTGCSARPHITCRED